MVPGLTAQSDCDRQGPPCGREVGAAGERVCVIIIVGEGVACANADDIIDRKRRRNNIRY